MLKIPASITVTFTSNYSGPHRICWRTGGTGPYNCTTIVSCVGGGTSCTGSFSVTVNNESCDDIIFDGYVQAACEAEGSASGRVLFDNTFTPNPNCKGYTLSCDSTRILGATITNSGTGYDPMTPPVVSIANGPGIGATASAVVGNGGILTETITNGGSLYVDGTYLNVPTLVITGSGIGATYTVVVLGGIIVSATITDPGSLSGPPEAGTGYAIGNTFEFNNVYLGGSGSGTIITVDTLNTGKITFINILTSGSGYVSIPSGTVAVSGVGSQATITLVLSDCPNYNAGNNCDATAKPSIRLKLGDSTVVCAPVTPPAPENPNSGIVIIQDACCYDCTSYTVDFVTGSATFIYTDCITRNLIKTTLTGPFNATVCMVTDSLIVQSDEVVTVTTGASC